MPDTREGDEHRRERGCLLSALRARLKAVASTGDMAVLLDLNAVTEARRLGELLRQPDGGSLDVEARLALGWWHWRRFDDLPVRHEAPVCRVRVKGPGRWAVAAAR